MTINEAKERESFEEWLLFKCAITESERDADGEYVPKHVFMAWEAWKAASAHQQDSLPAEAICRAIDDLDYERLLCTYHAKRLGVRSEEYNAQMAAAKTAETHADALRALLPPNTEAKS